MKINYNNSRLNGHAKYLANYYNTQRISQNIQAQQSRQQQILANQIRPNKKNITICNLNSYHNLHIHNHNHAPNSIPAPNTRRQSYHEERSNYCQ